MNIALFGAPGCGKGTQAQLLTKKLGMQQISTGDLFRSALKEKTDLGLKVKSYLDAGQLVPDETVVDVVKEAIKNLDKPFILDGFPRNLAQAKVLGEILNKLNVEISKFIFIETSEDVLAKRITGRRVCRSCGSIYHVETQPEKKTGLCDKCGGEVYQRSDDKLELVSERLKVYHEQTAPLKKYYRDKGCYQEIDGNQPSEKVLADILRLIEK